MLLKKVNLLFSKISSNKHSRELISKGTSALMFRLIGLFLSYFFTVQVTKYYGVDAWGVFTLFFAFIQISSKIARFGFDKGAIKFIAEYRVKENKDAIGNFYYIMILIVLVISSIFSIVSFIFSTSIAEFLFKNSASAIYIKYAASCIIPFSLTTINAVSLKALKKIKQGEFLGHTVLFLLAILGLFLIKNTLNASEKVIESFIYSIYGGCIISFIIWFKESQIFTIRKESIVKFKEIIRVSLPLIFAGSLFLILGWADTFMLGYFKTTEEVGAYNVITL